MALAALKSFLMSFGGGSGRVLRIPEALWKLEVPQHEEELPKAKEDPERMLRTEPQLLKPNDS
jgi:hypothetical protein